MKSKTQLYTVISPDGIPLRPQPTKQLIDVTVRYRMFTAQYVGPTESRGSRILIRDLRHKKRRIIEYDDAGGRTDDQAIAYLESVGISVDAIGLAHEDERCVLLSLDISTPLT